MTTLGLIGSGHIGSTVASLAVGAGHDVVLSNSRGPETLAGLVAELGPHARAATSERAAAAGDIVVVAVPVKAYPLMPAAPLAGKVVIDTGNYYPERDGQIPELDRKTLTESKYLLHYIPGARLVKAFKNKCIVVSLDSDRPGEGPKSYPENFFSRRLAALARLLLFPRPVGRALNDGGRDVCVEAIQFGPQL